jgi:hypothetical protein
LNTQCQFPIFDDFTATMSRALEWKSPARAKRPSTNYPARNGVEKNGVMPFSVRIQRQGAKWQRRQ